MENHKQEQTRVQSDETNHEQGKTGAPRRSVDSQDFGPLAVSRASEIEPEDVTWLWERRIPRGKLSALCGDSGTGKTWLTLNLAARLSRGERLPDESEGRDSPSTSIILNDEDGIGDTLRPRLDAMGAELSRIILKEPTASEPFDLSDEGHRGNLEALIRKTEADLVVIDPVANYCPGIEANSDEDVRAVLTPLAQIANRTDSAILFIRHFRKQEAAKALHRTSGSVAYGATARSVLAVGKHQGQRGIGVAMCNLAPKPPVMGFEIRENSLRWTRRLGITTDKLVDTEQPERSAPKRDAAKQLLKRTLWDRSLPANEVKKLAKEADVSEKTLERARIDLGITRENDTVFNPDWQEEWRWKLPDTEKDRSLAKTEGDSPQPHPRVGPNQEIATGKQPSGQEEGGSSKPHHAAGRSDELSDDPDDDGDDGADLQKSSSGDGEATPSDSNEGEVLSA